MSRYEYKVIPAPTRGLRGKGVKGADGKFANALEQVMNKMGADGWEYQRAETLPSEERSGLASKTTVFRNVLVFRRIAKDDPDAFDPKLLEAPKKTEADDERPEEDASFDEGAAQEDETSADDDPESGDDTDDKTSRTEDA